MVNILISIYILMFIATYGGTFAYFQRKFPTLAEES